MVGFIRTEAPSLEEKREAVLDWRKAAAHERFRVEHDLCYGNSKTAISNANLYERIANEIEEDVRKKEATYDRT